MSRQNKVNKGQYDQKGRLTPDEGASQAVKQRLSSGSRRDPTDPSIAMADGRAAKAAKARKPKNTRRM